MFYVYVLRSLKDNLLYTGFTNNIETRFRRHNSGLVTSTKNRLPLELIYLEGSLSSKDAMRREKYLKTAWGKRYIKGRLKNYFKTVPVR